MSEHSEQLPFVDVIETRVPREAVVIMCGLPATCKTWAATLITEQIGHVHLRTDLIRREVIKGRDVFDEKIAADMEQRKKVYELMFERAEKLASQGEGVILDATFIKQSLRERAACIAAKYRRPFVLIHTHCPPAIALERISKRNADNYESNAITEQAYYNNAQAFEPIDLEGIKKKFPALTVIYLDVETSMPDPNKWKVSIGRL